MCPHCGQNAPLVYRGVSAFCTACGQPRVPFTANAVNLKGKPAKIGGALASVFGWVLLFGTMAASLIVWGVLQSLFPDAAAGWLLGGVIATIGGVASTVLLLGGRALRRTGTSAAEAARLDALGTLAAHHKGNITAQNASEALGCPYEEADAFLTAMAKRPESGVSLEIDDEGKIYYRFARYAPAPVWAGDAKVRIDAAPAPEAAPAAKAEPPGRVVTEAMPMVPEHVRAPVLTGPGGTKVVPVQPGSPVAPRREAEVVAGDEPEDEANRRRAGS
jgi:hypothetical protein